MAFTKFVLHVFLSNLEFRSLLSCLFFRRKSSSRVAKHLFNPRPTMGGHFDPTSHFFASLRKGECPEALFYSIAGDMLILRIFNHFWSADMVSGFQKKLECHMIGFFLMFWKIEIFPKWWKKHGNLWQKHDFGYFNQLCKFLVIFCSTHQYCSAARIGNTYYIRCTFRINVTK